MSGKVKVWGNPVTVEWADPVAEPDPDIMAKVRLGPFPPSLSICLALSLALSLFVSLSLSLCLFPLFLSFSLSLFLSLSV